jgi:hypothetical protein
MQRGLGFNIAGLAAVLGCGAAQAEVVHRTWGEIADVLVCFMDECPPAGIGYTLDFDLDQDGTPDFQVSVLTDGEGGNDLALLAGAAGAVGPAVVAGELITGPLTSPQTYLATLYTPGYGNNAGPLGCLGCSAYSPLRFRGGDGTDHYGWVLISGHAPWFLRIDTGAYESTPGGSIHAGTRCCRADFDGDGDARTDLDIEAFFACLAGNCCPTCPPDADFDCNANPGSDADIEAFFKVLAGLPC